MERGALCSCKQRCALFACAHIARTSAATAPQYPLLPPAVLVAVHSHTIMFACVLACTTACQPGTAAACGLPLVLNIVCHLFPFFRGAMLEIAVQHKAELLANGGAHWKCLNGL